MGQKVHPYGIRLGIIKDWTSTWYADSRHYADYLNTDLAVRKFLRKKLAHASVSRIQIERPANNARIVIHTARPRVGTVRPADARSRPRRPAIGRPA